MTWASPSYSMILSLGGRIHSSVWNMTAGIITPATCLPFTTTTPVAAPHHLPAPLPHPFLLGFISCLPLPVATCLQLPASMPPCCATTSLYSCLPVACICYSPRACSAFLPAFYHLTCTIWLAAASRLPRTVRVLPLPALSRSALFACCDSSSWQGGRTVA